MADQNDNIVYKAHIKRQHDAYGKDAIVSATVDAWDDARVQTYLYKSANLSDDEKLKEGLELNGLYRMAEMATAFEMASDPDPVISGVDTTAHIESVVASAKDLESDPETARAAMDAVMEYVQKLKSGGYKPS